MFIYTYLIAITKMWTTHRNVIHDPQIEKHWPTFYVPFQGLCRWPWYW